LESEKKGSNDAGRLGKGIPIGSPISPFEGLRVNGVALLALGPEESLNMILFFEVISAYLMFGYW
jgi:hypothetical protein